MSLADQVRSSLFAELKFYRVLTAITVLIALLATLIGLGLGYKSHLMHQACESGQVFYDLGETDVPYRCTRVIDYPPTQGTE